MRYYVNWFFVVILISSLTSFIGKDRPVEGLSIGEYAPDFMIMSGDGSNVADSVYSSLSALHGNYVLVNFWASYDAESRIRNIELNHALADNDGDGMPSKPVSQEKEYEKDQKWQNAYTQYFRQSVIHGRSPLF